MTDLAAPDPGNYTFGAHGLTLGTPAVDVGNVVSARVTVTAESISHFSALFGQDVEDPGIVSNAGFSITAIMDEPNKANLLKFFMADASFGVGMSPLLVTNAVFSGVPIVGNAFTWAIPRVSVRPEGDFSYSSEDWSTFSLVMRVLYNAATPSAPFGTITHGGV